MAQATGTTDSYDLVGLAEDVEDVIFNISPTETPFLSKAKRKKATATSHQWQTDSLAAAAANRAIEGDESTYAAASPTVMLSNYTQISKKTVLISGTADAVRKYGRKEEFAYQIAKKGKELKRDIEYALVTNQASSAGGSSTARSSAGIESMIAGNRILGTGNSTGTTPGYAGGAWAVATFGGANKFSGVQVNQGRTAQAVVIGGVDLYISDFGEHKIMLNRYMRTGTVLCLDFDYLSVAWLRPIKFEERAKTGDATRGELLCEYTLVADNPDAHAKVQSVS